MPKFYFTTDNGKVVDADDEGVELPDYIAAKDEAQNALVDIIRERLPNGEHADFKVEVQDETGDAIYLALMKFEAGNPKEKATMDQQAIDEAVADVAAAINSMGQSALR
ncbi:DUF6894 family protein [Bosea sp. PAMC 26642]|uniref:DUF6894 family protein n=1 Tax=Bosea sp. (strain PAMC 26642) TaxID=1792307 RepID=UPI0007700901|nr:hypothetical protein [Bosea sp. PAMC 26642]AMJ60963.1 hypothetical protein AXW83_12235 [Bosea sp. PAMC 26642]